MKKAIIQLAVTTGLTLNVTALAAEPRMANEGIVGDDSGQVVTDSSGTCVGTSSWTKALFDAACGEVKKAAPEPEPVVAYAAPVPKIISEQVTLSSAALFGFDSAEFKREQPQLDALAERVKAMASIDSVNIVGHTDSVGAERYNQTLSERRAEAVRQFLISREIDPNIIQASGKGETEPVADNSTDAGRAQNRRVEISLKGTETRSQRR